MSLLTICLVTRGRKDFLKESLQSLQIISENKLVRILIIDNGSDLLISNQLKDWSKFNDASFIRFSDNDSRPNRVWKILREMDSQWVLFPGDDDVVLPTAISRFLKIISESPNLNAVCFNMQDLDVSGKLTSTIRQPAFEPDKNQDFQLASAFHEPAFLWPSLFINIKAIPAILPTSRYVFDWWIGIQLIIKGSIRLVNEVAVNYRVHPQQESNLATLRRKSFEASFWLIELIESDIFAFWLRSQSEKNLRDFWNQLSSQTPIYGNDQFGFVLQLSIAKKILRIKQPFSFAENIVSDLSAGNGIFLKKGDARNLLPDSFELSPNIKSNISVTIVEGSCQVVQDAAKYLSSGVDGQSLVVACRHSG